MRVRDVMSTGTVTVRKTDSLRSVVVKMINRDCGAIPVVDDDNNLIGIIALRDVLLPLYPNYGEYVHDNVHSRNFTDMEQGYPAVMKMNAEDVMTANPMTVSPDDPALKAASYMGLKNLRRIPVTDKGNLVGMVSIGDINRGLFLSSSFS